MCQRALSVSFVCQHAGCVFSVCQRALCVSFSLVCCLCVHCVSARSVCIICVSWRCLCIHCVSAHSVCVICLSGHGLCVSFVSQHTVCVSFVYQLRASFVCHRAVCACHLGVSALSVWHLCVSKLSVCSLCVSNCVVVNSTTQHSTLSSKTHRPPGDFKGTGPRADISGRSPVRQGGGGSGYGPSARDMLAKRRPVGRARWAKGPKP